MAWSAPASPWTSVAEIMTSAKLNILADDVRYLKGLAGDIYLEADLGVGTSAPMANLTGGTYGRAVTASTPNSDQINAVIAEGHRAGTDSGFAHFVGINRAATGTDKRAGIVGFLRDIDDNSGQVAIATRDSGTVANRFYIKKDGKVGVGTSAPQGLLHVAGATGGILFASVAAVTSLQTIASAGTVTSGAGFWIFDHNNTGGANVHQLPFLTLTVGTSTTYVNTDTITVAITAGGAITVTRTTGTNGTHDIQMMVIYR